MITVAHEALIDLIVDADGHVDPRLGGAGFNVTRAVARLGRPVAYLGRLSGDRFGQLIRANLDQPRCEDRGRGPVRGADHAGAGGPGPGRRAQLSLLPGRHLGGRGRVRPTPCCPRAPRPLHAGSLCLVMEPVGTSTEHMMVSAPNSVTVMLDPNCRPTAITSRQDYLDRLMRIARRADLVKVSTEDLAYMFPGQDAGDAAAELVAQGPACVLVTDGAAPVRAFAGGRQIRARRPGRPGGGHRGRRGRLRRRLPHLVARQRPGPLRPGRPGTGAPGDPGRHPRRGGDHHAPRRRTPVGLRAGRTRRLAVAAPGDPPG